IFCAFTSTRKSRCSLSSFLSLNSPFFSTSSTAGWASGVCQTRRPSWVDRHERIERTGSSLRWKSCQAARRKFYAFALLWLNGRDLRRLPLVERKKRLRKLIEKSESASVIYAQHVNKNGTALF